MSACVGGAAVAVKTVVGAGGSGTRTISVSDPAPTMGFTRGPLTASTVPSDVGPTWKVKFPSGRAIEVIAIGDTAAWWMPDGTSRPNPGIVLNDGARLPQQPRTRQVTVLIRSTLPQEEHLFTAFKRQTYISGTNRLSRNARFHQLISTMPADAAEGELMLGQAYGPWDVEVNYDVGPLPNARIPHGGPTILKVTSLPNSCVIRTSQPTFKSDQPLNEEFVLIRWNGEEVPATNGMFQPTYRDYTFPIPAAAANIARYRRRPYELVSLRNVALKLDVKTQPTVVTVAERQVEPAATQSAAGE